MAKKDQNKKENWYEEPLEMLEEHGFEIGREIELKEEDQLFDEVDKKQLEKMNNLFGQWIAEGPKMFLMQAEDSVMDKVKVLLWLQLPPKDNTKTIEMNGMKMEADLRPDRENKGPAAKIRKIHGAQSGRYLDNTYFVTEKEEIKTLYNTIKLKG